VNGIVVPLKVVDTVTWRVASIECANIYRLCLRLCSEGEVLCQPGPGKLLLVDGRESLGGEFTEGKLSVP